MSSIDWAGLMVREVLAALPRAGTPSGMATVAVLLAETGATGVHLE